MLNFVQIFGESTNSIVPGRLIVREFNVTHILLPAIIVSFSLISLAKYRNSRILVILSKLFLNSKNLENVIKEELRINSVSSIALLINYMLVLGLCLFLSLFHLYHLPFENSVYLALLITASLIILQIVGLWFIGFITNENKVITVPIIETVMIYETFGFLFFFIALCWLLNPDLSKVLNLIFVGIFLLEITIRILKSTIAVLRRGVSWYYIILYLCTLEILPFFVAYVYVRGNLGY